MIEFYTYSFIAMLVIAIYSLAKTKKLAVLPWIIILSFASYFYIDSFDISRNSHLAWESIRLFFIMILTLHFARTAIKSTLYMVYSVLCLSFVVLNCIDVFGWLNVHYGIYIGLTIFEMLIFTMGINSLLRARNVELTRHTNNHRNANNSIGLYSSHDRNS